MQINPLLPGKNKTIRELWVIVHPASETRNKTGH
jgi:hypothetical protein